MDLLETVLRSAGAKNYLQNFREHDVLPATLPILTDEDLKIIGVEDAKIRKNILHNASTLQIPAEHKQNLKIDDAYVNIVLINMNSFLSKHIANLTCTVMRDDVINCNVKTHEAARLLQHHLRSLHHQVNSTLNKCQPRKKKTSKKVLGFLFFISLATTIIVVKECIRK